MAIHNASIVTSFSLDIGSFQLVPGRNILVIIQAKYAVRLEASAIVTARKQAKIMIRVMRSRADDRWLSI
jgi:hypothetical protein